VLVTTDEKLKDEIKVLNPNFKIIFDTGVEKQLKFLKNEVKRNDVVLFEGPNIRLIQEIVK
jgi:hypothetical protein